MCSNHIIITLWTKKTRVFTIDGTLYGLSGPTCYKTPFNNNIYTNHTKIILENTSFHHFLILQNHIHITFSNHTLHQENTSFRHFLFLYFYKSDSKSHSDHKTNPGYILNFTFHITVKINHKTNPGFILNFTLQFKFTKTNS